MKKSILTVLLVLVSTSSFAQQFGKKSSATKSEVKAICLAVDNMLEVEQQDAAVDLKSCLASKKMKSTLVSEATIAIAGQIKFNTPTGSKVLTCNVAYVGEMKTENIIAGSLYCN